MKIGVDIDEVITELMKPFLEYSNSKNKTSFKLEEIDNYHLWETKLYNSKEEAVKDMIEFHHSEKFDDITLAEGVKEILNKVSRTHEIHFITSRPEIVKEKTNNFIKENFPEDDFKVIFSGEVYGGKSKSEICLEENISIFVEDNASYAFDCAKEGIKVFLIDKPWNKDYEEHENIIKVKNWNEILENLN